MRPAPSTDLACKELVELVTDYLEDALSYEDRTRFEQHLVMCGGCKEYLREMRSTIAISRKLSNDDLPPDVRDDLLAVFRKWKSESSR
jgi:hypothetical protein